ncbi:Transposase DDE domain protein [Bacteroidales bacterium Barb6XT]|nr:Transposase DDE domain protein [Bacteroidales bacterium Barb6XT]
MLLHEFPSWKLVCYYFSRWKNNGTIEWINDILRDGFRKGNGRNSSPSVGLIDSQSVKTTGAEGQEREFDGGKKIKGRKRHIITDTNGSLLSVKVHAASGHDGKGSLKHRFGGMKKIYADGGYRGKPVDRVKSAFGWDIKITLRTDKSAEFKPLPVRWVVERTFSRLENFRRLAKDYEYTTSSSQAMIYLSFINLMINRIIS